MLQKRPVVKPIGYYQVKYKDEKQAIYRAYLSLGYTLKELGEHFEKHYTSISPNVEGIEM
jgi:putative transposase